MSWGVPSTCPSEPPSVDVSAPARAYDSPFFCDVDPDPASPQAIGLRGPAEDAAVRLATLAVDAGARAIVCSPQEVAAVRAAVGEDIVLITPGVRPATGEGSARADQARVATPEEALAAGADLLVIGRPLTAAADPGRAARDLAEALADGARAGATR